MDSADKQLASEPDTVQIVEEDPEAIYESKIANLRAKGSNCLKGKPNGIAAKVWLTRIGKADFMTFEPKGGFDKDTGFVPQQWANMRVVKLRRDTMRMTRVDLDFEGFSAPDVQAKLDKLDSEQPRKARVLANAKRAVERVIRRNVDNNDLYSNESKEDWERIQPEDYDIFIGNVVPRE